MPFSEDLDWLRDEIVAAGAQTGVKIERADNIFRPGVILDQILDSIDAADVVVAVCTGRNANVFFELGYAWRAHSAVLVAETSDDLPFDVRHLRTEFYGGSGTQHGHESFRDRLTKAIKASISNQALPRGVRLTSPPTPRQVARLDARVRPHGKNSHVLEISNRGNVDILDVTFELPPEARNWGVMSDTLSSYPVKVLEPGDRVSALAAVSMGGPAATEITLRGRTADGEEFEQVRPVSLYG